MEIRQPRDDLGDRTPPEETQMSMPRAEVRWFYAQNSKKVEVTRMHEVSKGEGRTWGERSRQGSDQVGFLRPGIYLSSFLN